MNSARPVPLAGAMILLALLVASPLAARAQATGGAGVAGEAAEPPARKGVDEVVITATRSAANVDDVPASVSVISTDALENQNYNRIDEALRYEVGIYDGKLRGLSSSNQTLVMMNGMPLNSGWYGGVRWDNIATENVERVEIVRGPTSALYGGNAMGGTINVITKLPDEFEMGLRTRLAGDDNRSYGGSIGTRVSENLAFRIGFEYDQELAGRVTDYTWRPVSTGALPDGAPVLSGGRAARNRSGRDYWIVGDEGERQESQWNVNLTSQYDLTESASLRFDATVGYSDYQRKAPTSYLSGGGYDGAIPIGDDRYALVRPGDFLGGAGMDRNGSYMITYTDVFWGAEVVSKLGFQDESKWYTTPTPSPGQGYADTPGDLREFETDTYFTDVQASFSLGERNHLTTGVYGRLNTFDQAEFLLANYRDENGVISGETEITQGTDRYFALYLQDELTLVPDVLTAYLGARYDFWRAYDGKSGRLFDPDGNAVPAASQKEGRGSALSPSFSLVWNAAEDTTLRASVARAFRAPNLYDLYRSYQSSALSFVQANPDLDPESLWNFEVGAVQYLWDHRLRLSASVYQADVSDLIFSYSETEIDERGDEVRYSRKDNAGSARVRGLELSAVLQPWEGVRLWANYTDTNARIREHSRNPEFVGKRPTLMPELLINTGLDLEYESFRISLAGNYTGRIYRSATNDDIAGVFESNSKVWLWQLRLATDLPFEFTRLESAQLSITIRNLFDEDYYDFAIGRGRTVYAELRTKW